MARPLLLVLLLACGCGGAAPGAAPDGGATARDAGGDGARAPGCGDGVVGPGEQCDDGNSVDFDGCSALCRRESALQFKSFEVLPPAEICDYGDDGPPRATLNAAVNDAARRLLSGYWDGATMHRGNPTVIGLLGLDDLSDDSQLSVFIGFLRGTHGLDPLSLTAVGGPRSALPGRLSQGVLSTQPGRVDLPLDTGQVDPYVWHLEHFALDHIVLASREGELTGGQGKVCLGIPARELARSATGDLLGGTGSMLDLLALGFARVGLSAQATQPDLDFDHDGLERFLDTDGDARIDRCIDGDGQSIIDGSDCVYDPRIADGYSMVVRFELEAISLRPQ